MAFDSGGVEVLHRHLLHRIHRKCHHLWWHCSLSAIWLRRRSAYDGMVSSVERNPDWIPSRSVQMVISRRVRQRRKSNLRCDRAVHQMRWTNIRLRRDWIRRCDDAYDSVQRDNFAQYKIHRPATANTFPNTIVSFASKMLPRCNSKEGETILIIALANRLPYMYRQRKNHLLEIFEFE